MKEVADKIVELCAERGIMVHRYDASSTCSIYLKFDNGVLGSLRISDHPSKSKFKHKYEMAPTIKRRMVSYNGEGVMYIKYNVNDYEKFIEDLEYERKRLLDKWLWFRYEFYVEKYGKSKRQHNGQWRTNKLVQREFFI